MINVQKLHSKDGSEKYAFQTGSALQFEAAYFFIRDRERPHIACVSTQLGCATACPFCATASAGFFRNLTKEEILFQVQRIINDHDEERIMAEGFEVSFMGMGEPLANLQNVLRAIKELRVNCPSISRVSVSTSGPAKRIKSLISQLPIYPPVHLQISLHATNDRARRRLVPNAPGSMASLLQAGKEYHKKTGDLVCLNYILLKGVNDSLTDARWLAIQDSEAFYVKLTALNQIESIPKYLQAVPMDEMLAFAEEVSSNGMFNKVFIGDGLDVQASCGQLSAIPREITHL